MRERPSEESAREIVEAWLNKFAPGYPCYSIFKYGEDSWSFWIADQDTTSYVHADLSVEWYGTGWPDLYDIDEDSGLWAEVCKPALGGAAKEG
jgi:hypothetical protein